MTIMSPSIVSAIQFRAATGKDAEEENWLLVGRTSACITHTYANHDWVVRANLNSPLMSHTRRNNDTRDCPVKITSFRFAPTFPEEKTELRRMTGNLSVFLTPIYHGNAPKGNAIRNRGGQLFVLFAGCNNRSYCSGNGKYSCIDMTCE